MSNVGIAFLLTLIAGLATGIGGLVALFSKTANKKFLSVSLGFSAGVMIYISMVEILPHAIDTLSSSHGSKTGVLIAVIAFFGGMLLIALIDKFVPKDVNPHELRGSTVATPATCDVLTNSAVPLCTEDCAALERAERIERAAKAAKAAKAEKTTHHVKLSERLHGIDRTRLMRTGLFTALAISLHNFPEGLATFVTALEDPVFAIPIVVAIAIHNIPEGLAVSVPIYCASGSKRKAILYSFASGLTEPLGALIGFLILMPFLNDMVFGIVFALVAGIMVFISFDELLPSARAYGEHHLAIYGLVGGMAIMALSLWLFV